MSGSADPISLFASWLNEAEQTEPNDPNAMAVASVDADGQPSVRMVLLKDFGKDGFVFYTNFESRKGRAILVNPRAALLFHWKSLRRQVRIEGAVEQVSDAEADAYFASRDHLSKIGAHASLQSQPMAGAAELAARVAKLEAQFLGRTVPRPDHWSGFRVRPERIELWKDRPFRLHERRLFVKNGQDWTESLLFP